MKAGAAGGGSLGALAAGVGAGPGALIGGGLGAVGGCIVGGIAASETAQAVWNWAFGDDDVIADPKEILDALKEGGIEKVPDEITPDMPEDLKELVRYKNKVAESLHDLNESAKTLAHDPDNESARAEFIEASSDFSQAAEAYQYSAASMEKPEEVQAYIQKTNAPEPAISEENPYVSSTYQPSESNNNNVAVAP